MEYEQDKHWIHTQEMLQHSLEFIAYFELAEAKMNEWCQEITRQATHLKQQQEILTQLTEKSLTQINQHSEQLIHHIDNQLSQYSPQQLQHLTHESCERIKHTADDALHQGNKILHSFQIRFNLFTIFITILTAFIIVLYLNGELPWEAHHIAKNERQAGKMLLHIWPQLSQEEKTKLLSYTHHS